MCDRLKICCCFVQKQETVSETIVHPWAEVRTSAGRESVPRMRPRTSISAVWSQDSAAAWMSVVTALWPRPRHSRWRAQRPSPGGQTGRRRIPGEHFVNRTRIEERHQHSTLGLLFLANCGIDTHTRLASLFCSNFIHILGGWTKLGRMTFAREASLLEHILFFLLGRWWCRD